MKTNSTKKALLASLLSLLLCASMLVGSTFAWFTDTASTAVNRIQSGGLDVALQDMNGETLEGKQLKWQAADDRAEILWEPGCTYALQPFQVVNLGNLALRFRIAVSGVEGNPALLEALEFRVTRAGSTSQIDGSALSEFLDTYECILLPNGAVPKAAKEAVGTSGAITISVHMKETADNAYQGERIDGIAIAVTASQYTYETDGRDDQYDREAHAHSFRAVVTPPTCTEQGYTTYRCSFCDDGEVRDYVDALGHDFADGVCSRCGYTIYRAEGDFIYFGSYPQSQVTDSTLIETLNAQSRSAENDVTYAGEKYRYAGGKWYRYDPIKWRVCSRNAETGEAYLLAESILQNMPYYNRSRIQFGYGNKGYQYTVNGQTVWGANYQYSDVRAWLTETFFETAFNADQKQIALKKTIRVDGDYTGENVSDYVFLPSYSELESTFGANGYKLHHTGLTTTAYANVQHGSSIGYWLTRSGTEASGHSSAEYNVLIVSNSDGDVYSKSYNATVNDVCGVVPAMWVILK